MAESMRCARSWPLARLAAASCCSSSSRAGLRSPRRSAPWRSFLATVRLVGRRHAARPGERHAPGDPHDERRLDRRARRADADVPFIFTRRPRGESHTCCGRRSSGTAPSAMSTASMPSTRLGLRPWDDDRRTRPVRLGRRTVAASVAALRRRTAGHRHRRGAGRRRGSPRALSRIRARFGSRAQLDGVYGDGWSGAKRDLHQLLARGPARSASTSDEPDGPGRTRPEQVTIDVERIDSGRRVSTARWVVHSGAKRTFRLKTPAAPFRVKVSVQPTFSPAAVRPRRTRAQLGVQLAFRPG